jgi:putative transposase
LEKDKQMELLEKIRFERKKQKFKVWMDRFDDVIMDNENKLLIKLQYIHENPVEYGLVTNMTDYPHSSAAFYYLEKKVRIPVLHINEI